MLNNYPSDQMFIPLALLFCASYEAEYTPMIMNEISRTWVDTCIDNMDKIIIATCVGIQIGLTPTLLSVSKPFAIACVGLHALNIVRLMNSK
jgi:hypothetical protein